MIDMSVSVDEILFIHEKNRDLAYLLREYLLDNLEEIREQPDDTAGIIGYSYGTGYKDLICTIIPSKKEIKLGFYKGGQLPDPEKLLTGSGKVHKYVEIKTTGILRSPALKNLLMEAVNAYRERKRPGHIADRDI